MTPRWRRTRKGNGATIVSAERGRRSARQFLIDDTEASEWETQWGDAYNSGPTSA